MIYIACAEKGMYAYCVAEGWGLPDTRYTAQSNQAIIIFLPRRSVRTRWPQEANRPPDRTEGNKVRETKQKFTKYTFEQNV